MLPYQRIFSGSCSSCYSFVLQQLNLPLNTFEEDIPVVNSIMAEVAAEEYPYLVEMATEHIFKTGYNGAGWARARNPNRWMTSY